MAASSVSLALTGPAQVYHGFWHSHGTALPSGPMLTVSTFWFKFISAGIALLIAAVLARFWRFLGAVIFYFTFEEKEISADESQNYALVVNSKAALGALFAVASLTGFRRPSARRAVIFSASLLVVAIGVAIPALVAQISTYNQGLIASDRCTINAGSFSIASLYLSLGKKQIQWADAALSTVNANETTASPSARSTTPLPSVEQSYILECPPTASACDTSFPFTFSSNYTLLSRHFGLNTGTPFSLQVSHTCYRAQAASAPIGISGVYAPYGLYYGPVNVSLVIPGASYPYTELYYQERKYSPGYTLSQHSALADATITTWSPNSTLVLGGDTTALFYYVGGVTMFQPSTDPIFATAPTPSGVTVAGPLYDSVAVVSPVMCDTKYMFCAPGNCSPLGGLSKITAWFGTQSGTEWTLLKESFSVLLADPPIYLASLGSSAIAAAESANFFQLDPTNANTTVELGRLTRAGMAMLASVSQLTAAGYWDLDGSAAPPTNFTFCKNVLIDTSAAITVSLTPYIYLLAISFVVVVVSYTKYLPWVRKSRLWRQYADAWALHYAGQLHREVVAQLCGLFEKVDTTAQWPNLSPKGHAGPDIVINGSMRFGRG
jgi:hypothetical protein